jgi:agmatine/peptidylarginine deiminase
MNNIWILVLFISINFCSSEDFEGTIEYENTFKVLSKEDNETSLKNDLGTKMTFVVKNGFTKETTDGAYGNIHIFNPKENRIYFTDKFSADTLYYHNGTKNEPYKNATFEVVKNAGNILGLACDKLIYRTENYEIIYFYAKDLKYDPKYVKNFGYLNKNKKIQLMKSIILKQIMTSKSFIVTVEAVKIKPGKISDKQFVNPKHKVLKEQ